MQPVIKIVTARRCFCNDFNNLVLYIFAAPDSGIEKRQTPNTNAEKINPPGLKNAVRQNGTGLLLQLFELKDILLEKGIASFRSSGTCMLPCICPGDMLSVGPVTAGDISLGDIVVFRRGAVLFSHRAVRKGSEGGVPYVVTRADNTETDDDGKIFDADIIGVVRRIQRNGRDVPLSRATGFFAGRFARFLLTKKYRFKARGRFYLATVVALLHALPVYGFITSFGRDVYRLLRAEIQMPVDTSRFWRKVSPGEFAGIFSARGSSIRQFKIIGRSGTARIGSISLVYEPETRVGGGWWISGTDLKLRYRGTVPEYRLWEQVGKLMTDLSMGPLYLDIPERDYFNRFYFRRSGFIPRTFYRDKRTTGNQKRLVYVRKHEQ